MSSEHPFFREAKETIKPQDIQTILLDDLLRVQHEMYKMEKAKKPEGLMCFYSINLVAGQVISHFDFESGNGNDETSLPDGTEVKRIPGKPLHFLTVRNDGPGEILFSINRDVTDFADVLLKKGEAQNIDARYGLISTINLEATTGNATVRLTGFY